MTADINKKHLMHLNKYNTCLEKIVFSLLVQTSSHLIFCMLV